MDDKKVTADRKYYLFGLRIVGDFGATIALPVVVFVLIGQYFDTKWHTTTPWFMMLGFVLAALVSGRIIYRKAKIYGSEYESLTSTKK